MVVLVVFGRLVLGRNAYANMCRNGRNLTAWGASWAPSTWASVDGRAAGAAAAPKPVACRCTLIYGFLPLPEATGLLRGERWIAAAEASPPQELRMTMLSPHSCHPALLLSGVPTAEAAPRHKGRRLQASAVLPPPVALFLTQGFLS